MAGPPISASVAAVRHFLILVTLVIAGGLGGLGLALYLWA